MEEEEDNANDENVENDDDSKINDSNNDNDNDNDNESYTPDGDSDDDEGQKVATASAHRLIPTTVGYKGNEVATTKNVVAEPFAASTRKASLKDPVLSTKRMAASLALAPPSKKPRIKVAYPTFVDEDASTVPTNNRGHLSGLISGKIPRQ
jgi:hypothetical protein